MEPSIRTLSLLRAKVEATTFLSRGKFRQLRDQNQLWILPIATAGVLVGVASMVFMLWQNYLGLFRLGHMTGNDQLVLFAGILTSWVISFAVVLPLGLSMFYLSRDGRMLIALPIPTGRIVGVNYLLLYAYSLPVQFVAYLPAMLIYIRQTAGTAATAAASAVVLLTGSVIPLSIAMIIVLGIGRAVNLSRHRTALEVTGMAMLVVLLIGFQTIVSRGVMNQVAHAGGNSASAGTAAGTTLAQAFASLERILVPVAWGARAAIHPSSLILFLAASGAAAAISFTAVRLTYVSEIIGRMETRTARRSVGTTLELPKSRSALRALVGREFSILSSNSSFLFEAFGEVFILPIVLVVISLVTPKDVFSAILPAIRSFPYMGVIVLAVLSLMAGFNTVSATSVSREGKNVALSLELPLAGSVHLRGKLISYFLLFYPAFVANSVILTILFSLPPGTMLALIAAGVPVLLAVFNVTIYPDLRRPLLDWSHPQQAMKQNMNVIVSMGLVVVTLIVVGGLTAAAAAAGVEGTAEVLVAGGVAAVIWLAVRQPMRRFADRRYRQAFSAGRTEG